MKFLNPKEFQLKKGEPFFEGYLNYLRQLEKENKKKDTTQIEELRNRMIAYEKMLVLNHMEFFSLEELQFYFHMEEKFEELEQLKLKFPNSISVLTNYCSWKKFYEDEAAMKSSLKTQLNKEVQKEKVFFSDLQSFKQEQEEIENLEKTIEEQRKKVVLASQILKDASYESFFKTVGIRNRRVLFHVLEVQKNVLSFFEIEKNRLLTLTKMVAVENVLEDIYLQIKEKSKVPFFRKKRNCVEEIEPLKENYKKIVNQNQTKMQKRKIDGSKRKSYFLHGICEETQFFYNTDSAFSWEDFITSFLQKQEQLIKKLYSFDVDKEGFYHFETSREEREQILKMQSELLAILDHSYFICKKEEKDLETNDFDVLKRKTLESILGVGSNLSRETLAYFVYHTNLEMNKEMNLLSQKKQMINNHTYSFRVEDFPFYLQLLEELDNDFLSSKIGLGCFKKL